MGEETWVELQYMRNTLSDFFVVVIISPEINAMRVSPPRHCLEHQNPEAEWPRVIETNTAGEKKSM